MTKGKEKSIIFNMINEKIQKLVVDGEHEHSIFVHCLLCGLWGINMPFEKECGNCNSKETVTYYPEEFVEKII